MRRKLHEDTRKSSSAIGYFCNETLDCLQKTIAHVKGVENLINSASVKNSDNLRTDCITSELYIEHFFGSNVQTATADCLTLEEYVYKKRKLELKAYLQNTRTPFHFCPDTNKLYAKLRECNIDAWYVLKMISSQDRRPICSQQTAKSESNKKFLQLACQVTKGSRCQSVRYKWKKRFGSKPYVINK